MTDTKHTPGPLVADAEGAIYTETPSGPVPHIAYVEDTRGFEDAITAARLAACYNALEGLTNDEVAALPDADTIRAWLAERAKCKMCDDFGYYWPSFGPYTRCTHCCSSEAP